MIWKGTASPSKVGWWLESEWLKLDPKGLTTAPGQQKDPPPPRNALDCYWTNTVPAIAWRCVYKACLELLFCIVLVFL